MEIPNPCPLCYSCRDDVGCSPHETDDVKTKAFKRKVSGFGECIPSSPWTPCFICGFATWTTYTWVLTFRDPLEILSFGDVDADP